jgi:hypothetical protein
MLVGPVTVIGDEGPVTFKSLNCLPETELVTMEL